MRYKHSHCSSLSECPKCGEAYGPMWAGRKFWYVYPDTDRNGEPLGRPKEKRFEWNLLTRRNRSLAFSLHLWGGDSSDEILFHVAVPFLFSLWFGLEGYIYSKTGRYDTERAWGASWGFGRESGDLGTVRIEIANNTGSWSNGDPWWHSIFLDVADRLLGAFKYNNWRMEAYQMKARMPEGEYDVELTREYATWERPRLFGLSMRRFGMFFKERRGFDIKCEKGIPVPGKGENSWDCADDAIFGTGSAKEDPEDALNEFIARVIEIRQKRDGAAWSSGRHR